MIKIKLSTNFPELPIIRQTPESKGFWDDCIFFVNQDVDECDWWFVYEDLTKPEVTKCPTDHLVFITGEPPATRLYDPKFLAQFSAVITSHTDLAHQNTILTQQALPWHIGTHPGKDGEIVSNMDFNDFHATGIESVKKSKLISVISSNKKFTKGHRARLKFIECLLERLGDKVDFFGKGFHEVPDKWQAIAPYKYHIALENSAVPDYFTEKITDAYLGWSYPIYYGCPNITDYFSPLALSKIDILDIERSIDEVEKLIYSDIFERNQQYLAESRNLVLFRYNMFQLITEFSRGNVGAKKEKICLYPERYPQDTRSKINRIFRKVKHYGPRKYYEVIQEKYLN